MTEDHVHRARHTHRNSSGHSHAHTPPSGIVGWLKQIFHLHGHDHAPLAVQTDPAFAGNQEGICTVWLALIALSLTSLLQVGVVAVSGSVALLSDTAHNIGDSLNSIPLLIAFYLARRMATRRYTYGFGRAEDVAGLFIVLSVVVSAAIAIRESIQKFFDPQPMQNIPVVMLAAVIGFVGNEAVALLQIRTGRKMGSEAMLADGLHARIDGLTSLAVLIAAVGTALGFPLLDPIIGLLIGITVLFIARDVTVRMWYRLMDAVDPALVNQIEHYTAEVAGVEEVSRLRVRWVGHQLFAELTVIISETLSLVEGHQIVQNIEKVLKQAIPNLGEVRVQLDLHYRHAPLDTGAMATILPPRYENYTPSAAPMGAAALQMDAEGNIAWDEIWTGFCDLALAGGPSHRGTLLEPVEPATVLAKPEQYEAVLRELERGLRMVTGLETVRSASPGWIGLRCTSEDMALWLLRAIIVENVSVRREGAILYFPAGSDFRIDKEIKNVITVVAKTNHYWQEHMASVKPS